MELKDYIRGERHGAAARDLELEAMRDPLLADALDGYRAVQGDHSAVLDGLAGRVRHSAAGGRASARSRASRRFERRVRVWSAAVAAAMIGGVIAGGVWLFGSDVPAENDPAARQNGTATAEVEAYLPPVAVAREPVRPTETDASRLGRDEIRSLATERPPISDSTTTVAFRRHAHAHGATIGGVDGGGALVITFNVGANGRPRDIEVAGSPPPSPEARAAAVELLAGGPDWPAEQILKTIIIKL